jgi:hypothetical protein
MTSCSITIEPEFVNIQPITLYCESDGYPKHMGEILKQVLKYKTVPQQFLWDLFQNYSWLEGSQDWPVDYEYRVFPESGEIYYAKFGEEFQLL